MDPVRLRRRKREFRATCPCGTHDPYEPHPTPPVKWVSEPLTAAQLAVIYPEALANPGPLCIRCRQCHADEGATICADCLRAVTAMAAPKGWRP